MIRLFIARMRELVWPAVLAAVLSPLAIVMALINPDSVTVPLTLGLAAVTMALLSNRA